MYILVGLGNPGLEYRDTRHNIGFMTIDMLGDKFGMLLSRRAHRALIGETRVKGERVVLAKPQTYMNLSGESVRKLVRKYCDDESELIVVYDDADLPVGRMRLREEGSSGTHNGMRSIVSALGTTEFKRLRIGIKNAELASREVDIADYVLSRIDYADKKTVEKCVEEAAEALLDLVGGADIQRIEERLNRRK